MKARTFILTIGAALALVAPAANAAHTAHLTNGLGCSFEPPSAGSGAASQPKPFYNPLNPRGLQAVRSVRTVATSRPLQVVCGGKASSTVVAPTFFQILRNSL